MYWTILTPVKHFRLTFLLVQTAVTYRSLSAAAIRHHTPQTVILVLHRGTSASPDAGRTWDVSCLTALYYYHTACVKISETDMWHTKLGLAPIWVQRPSHPLVGPGSRFSVQGSVTNSDDFLFDNGQEMITSG